MPRSRTAFPLIAAAAVALLTGGVASATDGPHDRGHEHCHERHHESGYEHSHDYGRDYGHEHGRGGYEHGRGGYEHEHGRGGYERERERAWAEHSPGVLSGNVVETPVRIPVNVCGDSVDALAALNPSMGNVCKVH
ncbi:chaplin [Streptomyces luteireticuli]|uniref:Chaplin domain-containing protein n=1 Tax=Streptomyces luteireticuli TaxID=173858 RepID=A0ABN0YYD8_9ACTN